MENQTASHALPKIDIYDLDTYAKGVPHADFTELRAHAPVSFHGEPGGRGFWVISKYSDVVDISKNPRDFSSARGGTNIPDYAEEDLSQIQLLMVNMDPPQHARFRKLVARGFTPRIVQLMEPKIRAEVDEILNEVIAKGTGACDFVRDIAAELPLRVIAELLGVPREDRQKIFDWSNQLIGFDDPEFQTSIEDARQSAMEIWMYANSLAEDRLDKDGTDLISVLINSEIDGEKLSEMEFDAFFLLLSVAGNETTRNALSGGMLALLEPRPDGAHARQPGAHLAGRRGDPPLGDPGQPLPPHGHARPRGARRADEGERQGRHLLLLGQPRRRCLHRPLQVRHHA